MLLLIYLLLTQELLWVKQKGDEKILLTANLYVKTHYRKRPLLIQKCERMFKRRKIWIVGFVPLQFFWGTSKELPEEVLVSIASKEHKMFWSSRSYINPEDYVPLASIKLWNIQLEMFVRSKILRCFSLPWKNLLYWKIMWKNRAKVRVKVLGFSCMFSTIEFIMYLHLTLLMKSSNTIF